MTARLVLMLGFLLSACSAGEESARDPKAHIDPALAAALEDQILIDPTLSQQANEDVIRPPDRPVQILVPLDADPKAPVTRKPGN